MAIRPSKKNGSYAGVFGSEVSERVYYTTGDFTVTDKECTVIVTGLTADAYVYLPTIVGASYMNIKILNRDFNGYNIFVRDANNTSVGTLRPTVDRVFYLNVPNGSTTWKSMTLGKNDPQTLRLSPFQNLNDTSWVSIWPSMNRLVFSNTDYPNVAGLPAGWSFTGTSTSLYVGVVAATGFYGQTIYFRSNASNSAHGQIAYRQGTSFADCITQSWNIITTNNSDVFNKIGASLGRRMLTTQSIADNATDGTVLLLDSTDTVSENQVSSVGISYDNTTGRFTNNSGGVVSFNMTYSVTFPLNSNGWRSAWIRYNGDVTNRLGHSTGVGNSLTGVSLTGSCIVTLNNNEYVQLCANQSSGASMTLGGNYAALPTGYSTRMQISRLSK